jgi:hypothetical protein
MVLLQVLAVVLFYKDLDNFQVSILGGNEDRCFVFNCLVL